MSFRIRPATAADAPAIASVYASTRRSKAATAPPTGALALPSAQPVLVAVDRTEIVGFAASGPTSDADAGPWTGELFALLVRPDRWGSAAGRALWVEATAALARAGSRGISLWVPEDNPRARRFFEREGAKPDGEARRVTDGGVERVELRYRAPLSARHFAEGFAAALGRLDEQGLARFLDPACTWAGGAGFGQDGVLAAIRARAAAPPDALDSFIRECTVSAISGDRYRVQVSDRMRSGGHAHTWRHALALTIPSERGVLNTVPLDLPGEPARLAAFLRRIGVYA